MLDAMKFGMEAWRFESLASCHDHLLEIIAGLHAATLKAPRSAEWDEVRMDVRCLDAIADRMRQALTE